MKARTVNAVFFSFVLLLVGAGAADAETAPFRIAVIGDSVMWGEGLHDLQKVSTKVHQHLQNNLGGRAVSLQHLAHCGAVIGPADPQQEAEAAAAGMNGELPRPLPSISYQADHQVVDPAGIDLQEISPLIAGWRATNTPNTLALKVVTNSMSGSSISITVYATDAISGAPRSGTVSIEGVSGPTGSRITYRRCLATEDGKLPYGPCPGQVSVDGYEEAAFER